MAILSTVKKFLPYVKTATGYVLYRLSSQAVQMDDGNTLQAAYNSLNSKILNFPIKSHVEYGHVDVGSISGNSSGTVNVKFDKAFPTGVEVIVLCTPHTSSTADAAFEVIVYSVSSTGFTLKLTNRGSIVKNGMSYWMAFY